MNEKEWLQSSLKEVYSDMGGIGMTYAYIPLIEQTYSDEGLAILNYDYANKIPINAALNTLRTGDADFEYESKDVKNNRENVTIQFTLDSIYPRKVKDRDAIEVTIGDTKKRYLILGTDNGIVLQGVYYSVRATLMQGATQEYEVLDNGTPTEI